LILEKYPGDIPVYLYLEAENKSLVANRSLWIDIGDNRVIYELEQLLGKNSIKIV
jgi:DNA polymerase-3 subunit alpha